MAGEVEWARGGRRPWVEAARGYADTGKAHVVGPATSSYSPRRRRRCHLTQERRVQTRVDDVAGSICRALARGRPGGLPARV